MATTYTKAELQLIEEWAKTQAKTDDASFNTHGPIWLKTSALIKEADAPKTTRTRRTKEEIAAGAAGAGAAGEQTTTTDAPPQRSRR